ncbi:hypothetical protein N7471_010655 [Penicillium samsonianum]|uniref:uncharacterized protein n=1 Tax=Penicillium samsonianum TaxID=1882272 RepID=UPI002549306B|nr:uncharacterized protein N7471_010655 [Penicillium samsonianum]KAJ6126162.1 hypothetical protein N7471_010655 [Penicillium samsonianum]
MSGAEILAAIVIVGEAADTVSKVVNAMQTTKDFVESFQGKKNHSQDVQNYVDGAKESIIAEINAVEFQGYMNLVNRAASWWYECQSNIQLFGIDKHTVTDTDGELKQFADDIHNEIGPLDGLKVWIEGDRPRPQKDKMLGFYLLFYAIRHSMRFTYETFFLVRTGNYSATFEETAQTLEDAKKALQKRFDEYKIFRASQLINIVPITEGVPGAQTFEYLIRTDIGGDDLIPNLTNALWISLTPDASTEKVRKDAIKHYWRVSDLGKRSIDDLFKSWTQAHTAALLLRHVSVDEGREYYNLPLGGYT